MTTPLVTQQIEDLVVAENSGNVTLDLSSNFDDPSTTGQIARFEFADNVNNGGTVDVLLFDQAGIGAPVTVANFLNYVGDGDYDNTIIHRSVPGFIIQGGGFDVTNSQITPIAAEDPIVNEFNVERSNLRGTIATAKLDGDPDSATNEWFFNLADNSENLDNQNGGFTAFGQVLDDEDLETIDAIANFTIIDGDAPPARTFDNLPVTDATAPIDTDDLVFLESVTLVSEDELDFSVVNNSNGELVDVTINDDGELLLDYAPDQSGEATITLEATNLLGESVQDEFVVTVEETPDAETPDAETPDTETPDADLVGSTVFRFLDPDSGIHFYASSEEEQEELESSQPDYISEAPTYRAVDPLTGNSEAQEVFSLFNEDTGAYLYTTSENELSFIEENLDNYTLDEDKSFLAFTEEQPGTTAVYRFLDTNTGGHFYTASEGERASIEDNLPNYESEDIAFYAFPVE